MSKEDDFVAPYDLVADKMLKARGWRSRRDEGWSEHMYDMWTWPQTEHGPGTLPTEIHCEGRSFRVYFASSSLLVPRIQLTFANRAELLTQLPTIEMRDV